MARTMIKTFSTTKAKTNTKHHFKAVKLHDSFYIYYSCREAEFEGIIPSVLFIAKPKIA